MTISITNAQLAGDFTPINKTFGNINPDYVSSCTPSSKKSCIGNNCTNTNYLGVIFTEEDGDTCTKIEDARSLVGSAYIVKILYSDKDHLANVIDYNFTTITVELISKDMGDIPTRIWGINEVKEKEYLEAELEKDANFKLTLLDSYKETYDLKEESVINFKSLEEKKIVTYEMTLDDILEFGYNSTVVSYEINEGNANKAYGSKGGAVGAHGTDTPIPPGDILYTTADHGGAEYDSTQYGKVAANDGDSNTWENYGSPANNAWVNLWYHFKITETVADITEIEVVWDGYDQLTQADDFEFDIWNYDSVAWEVINTTTTAKSADVRYGTNITADFDHYINATGDLHLGISGDYKAQSGGCAFIYSYDGEFYYPEMALADMQSVDSGWIMTSYGTLNKLEPVDDVLTVGVWERVRENSYIDTLDLIEIKSVKDKIILPEQYSGTLHTIAKDSAVYPSVFTNGYDDYTHEVRYADDSYWVTNLSRIDTDSPPMWDEAYLTFDTSSYDGEDMKLVVRGKETGLFGKMIEIMTTALYGPNVKFPEMSDEFLEKWLDWGEDAAMTFYYEDNGEWIYAGRLFFGNVEFYHTYVLPLEAVIKPETNFKIVGIPYGLQIDEIYLDFSEDEKIKTTELKPTVVSNNMGLSNDDLTLQLAVEDYDFVFTQQGDLFEVEYETDCKDCVYVLKSFGTANLWSLSKGEINQTLVDSFFEDRAERGVIRDMIGEELKTELRKETTLGHASIYEDYVKVVITSEEAPEDSCTYDTGDWNVDCSDNCIISSDVHGDGGTMTFYGTGTTSILADIYGFNSYSIGTGCVVSCASGKCLHTT